MSGKKDPAKSEAKTPAAPPAAPGFSPHAAPPAAPPPVPPPAPVEAPAAGAPSLESIMAALSQVVGEFDTINARIDGALALLKPIAVVAQEIKPGMMRSDVTEHLREIKARFNDLYFAGPAPALTVGDET